MSESSARSARQIWAMPHGSHDRLVARARVVLPMLIGVLGVALIAAPLTMHSEISFVLAKDNVALARERMRVTAAEYRGEDSNGQPFVLRAGSAVQVSSRDPVVRLRNLDAQIGLADGPARMHADSGRYDMDREIVRIDGPLAFTTADGYHLATRDVVVGLKSRRLASGGPVDGVMPLGSFSADRIAADLSTHVVTLNGRARLHIVQGGAR